MGENSGTVVSEYFTNVAEVKRLIDEKICHLKEELELRRVALNGKVDSFNLHPETNMNIRFDWSDCEIVERIGSLGNVELETIGETETDKDILSSGKDTLSSDKDTLSSGKDTFSSGKDTLSSGKDTFSSNKDTLSSGKDTLSSDKDTLSSDKDTLISGKDTLISGKDTLISDKDTLSSDKDTLSSDKSTLSSGKDTLSSNKDTLSSDKDTVSSDKDTLSSDKNTVSSDKDTLSSDKDTLSSDKDTLSSGKDTLSSDKNTLSSDKDTLSPDKDTLSSGKDTLSSNKDTVSSDKDTVSSDKNTVSSDKDTLSSDKNIVSLECPLDSDIYMTMKRPKKNEESIIGNNETESTFAITKIPTNFGINQDEMDGLLSPVLKKSSFTDHYIDMKSVEPLDTSPKMKRSTSLSSFEQLRAMFEPNLKYKRPNKKRKSQDIDTVLTAEETEESLYSDFTAPFESKQSLAKWKSEEVLIDPIYEVIDERQLRNVMSWAKQHTGALGSKRKVGKVSDKLFDLPVIARCTQGKRLGQLDKPKSVAVSATGLIYVAEKGNNRIQVFNSEAYHLFSFGEKSGTNKMTGPYGVYVREEVVYVTLTNQHTIQMYTAQGVFIRQKCREGREEGKLKLPTGLDGEKTKGRVFICDTGNNRIQIFDKNLKFIKVVRTTKLDKPLAIKVVRFGEFMVLDRSPVCIHFFNTSGELIRDIIDTRYHQKLINPLYFTLSPEGQIIVSDFSSHSIHVFSGDGTLCWTLGDGGKGKPLEEPRGIVCDMKGRLVTVCNKKQEALQIFEI